MEPENNSAGAPAPGTPLPWEASEHAEGTVFEIIAKDNDETYVASCHFGSPTVEPYLASHSQAKANARYIVTACNAFPDLLEALEDLASLVLGTGETDGLSPPEWQRLANAQEAIAKAKGGEA